MKNHFLAFLALSLPAFVLAQTYDNSLFGLANYLIDLIKNVVLWLIFSFAIIFFLWNIIKFLRDPSKVSQSGSYIIWGIVALTVMFSIYGLIGLVAETFGLEVGIPQFFVGGK
jgi:flagellar biosynthesis protein FlhB